MKTLLYNCQSYDREFFEKAAEGGPHQIDYVEALLDETTAVLADGYEAVCVFVNDTVNAAVLARLAEGGVKCVALRCAGFNNVDLEAAAEHGLRVVRVPAYSPHAVAEHAAGLILSLNRKLHRAYHRVRDGNFRLNGLLGFDLVGRTVGVVGTGQIGARFADIMNGFGCQLLGYDLRENPECLEVGMRYVSLDELFGAADILSLHCPLTPDTHHLINAESVASMKQGVMIVNTSRGAVINTQAVIDGLKSGRIGALGLDVYEEEGDVFFQDLSDQVIPDDTLARLLTFPNVLITGHQAFFTREALTAIAETTLGNLSQLEGSDDCDNEVRPD